VLALWEGLGYYNRARLLQRTAQAVIGTHGGRFPTSLAALQALPGIGRYTAGAVMSFAFDLPAPVVDGNVARVLARLMNFDGEVDGAAGQRQLWQWAEELVPGQGVRQYNSALMELGQRVCTPGPPACDECPVRRWCRASAPAALPRKKPPRPTVAVEEEVIVARKGGKILLQQECGTRRRGMWKLPAVDGRPRGRLLWQGRYSFTHHRVTLRLYAATTVKPTARPGEAWIPEEDVATLPMPSPFRRALAAVRARP